MKKYEAEMGWTEQSKEKPSFVLQIKERVLNFLSNRDQNIAIEDRYELESCKTLEYESVAEWILHNKKDQYDGALLVRIRNKKDVNFPIIVSIMFLNNNKVCLGKENIKKIVHCTYISEELDNMFDGEDSLILK